MKNTITKKKNYNRKRETTMNNTLTVETPITFKHTINLNDFPEFNQLSEEKIESKNLISRLEEDLWSYRNKNKVIKMLKSIIL